MIKKLSEKKETKQRNKYKWSGKNLMCHVKIEEITGIKIINYYTIELILCCLKKFQRFNGNFDKALV